MTLQEFGQKIKTKYPQYKDVDDVELANKVIAKHPQYKSQINDDRMDKAKSLLEKIPKEPLNQPKKKSLGRKVVDFFTSNEQAFGQTLGDAVAVQSKDIRDAQQSQTDLDDMNFKVAEQIKKLKAEGKDTSKLEKIYEQNTGNKFDLGEVAPSVNKSAKQIYGEGLGVATDIASFGKYGKLGKSKTATEALAKGFLKYGSEGAITGGAFGASQAMQDDESVKEIFNQAKNGALVSGLISGVLGGFSAKKKFNAPDKANELREKAIAQYKKGLQATKEKFKDKSDKVIPDLLKEEKWGTFKGLMKKADDGIALSEKEYKKLGELQGVIEINGLLDNLDNELEKLLRPDGNPISTKKTSYNQLLALKNDILAIRDKAWIGGGSIHTNTANQQKLRELAQAYGQELYDSRKAMKTINDSKTLSMVKSVDDSIRNLLNTKNPKYSEINKVYSLNTKLKDILIETAKRKEGHKVFSMVRGLTSGSGLTAGAVIGGLPGAIATGFTFTAVAEVLNSTWWNTMRAVQKNKLADKIMAKSKEEISVLLLHLAKKGYTYAKRLLNDEI